MTPAIINPAFPEPRASSRARYHSESVGLVRFQFRRTDADGRGNPRATPLGCRDGLRLRAAHVLRRRGDDLPACRSAGRLCANRIAVAAGNGAERNPADLAHAAEAASAVLARQARREIGTLAPRPTPFAESCAMPRQQRRSEGLHVLAKSQREFAKPQGARDA